MLHKWKVLGQPTFSLEYPCQRLRIAEGLEYALQMLTSMSFKRFKRGRLKELGDEL